MYIRIFAYNLSDDINFVLRDAVLRDDSLTVLYDWDEIETENAAYAPKCLILKMPKSDIANIDFIEGFRWDSWHNPVVLNDYNATIYDYVNDWVGDRFINKNRIQGAYYYDGSYLMGECGSGLVALLDTVSPVSRVFCIDSEEKYRSIFGERELGVDFSNEVLYLQIHLSNISPDNSYYIYDISEEGRKTNITLRLKSPYRSIMLDYPRCILVRMKRTNPTDVKVTVDTVND